MINRLLKRFSKAVAAPGKVKATKSADRRPDVPAPQRRRMAIAELDDPLDLLALMDDAEWASAARKRLSALFEAGVDPLVLASEHTGLAVRRHLLEAATAPEHWQPLLEGFDGDDLLADVACHHPLTAVRQAAAARVVDEATLRRVEKVCRDRDKVVARQMRERLEPLRACRRRLEEIDDRLAGLADDLRHLSRTDDEPRQAERLTWLCAQHQDLLAERGGLAALLSPFGQELPPPPAAVDAFTAILDEIEARREAERQAEAAELAARQARRDAEAAQEAAVDGLELLLAQLCERLDGHAEPAAERSQLRAALALEQGRFEDVSREYPPDAALIRRQQRTHDRLEALLAALDRLEQLPECPTMTADTEPDALKATREVCLAALAELAWPAGIPTPEPVRQFEATRAELDAALASHDEHLRKQGERLRRNLGRLEGAIERGDMRQAQGIRHDIDTALAAGDMSLDERLQQRAERLVTRVDELADWQRYATAPKRQELCEAMEQLANETDVAPEPRAARVRHLREQWNELGPARDDEARSLATRFNAAAEAAFAPCRAYFEAQAERHRFNAENRKRICDELATFIDGYDWQTPDWRAVERIYQEARREWRRYADVDPRERSQNRRYHELTRSLRDRLQERWQANIATKEQLLEQAEALAAAPDAGSAATAKRLQAEWKQVDITPRGADRKLWERFRGACDQIFAGLADQQQSTRQAFDADMTALEAAFAELLPHYAGQSELTLRQRQATPDGQLRELEGQLATLARGAPREGGKRLEALERKLSRLRSDAKVLAAALKHREVLMEAETALAAIVPTTDDHDPQATRAAVIDLELALGIDSPAEDAQLRMERQVKRLESGLRGSGGDEPVAAALAALQTTAADPGLLQRAQTAVAAALDAKP